MGNQPIAVIAEVLVNPQTIDQSRKIIETTQKNSKQDGGCLYYQLYQDPEISNRFILIERWASKPIWDKHLESSHITEARNAITPHLLEPIKIEWFVEQI